MGGQVSNRHTSQHTGPGQHLGQVDREQEREQGIQVDVKAVGPLHRSWSRAWLLQGMATHHPEEGKAWYVWPLPPAHRQLTMWQWPLPSQPLARHPAQPRAGPAGSQRQTDASMPRRPGRTLGEGGGGGGEGRGGEGGGGRGEGEGERGRGEEEGEGEEEGS